MTDVVLKSVQGTTDSHCYSRTLSPKDNRNLRVTKRAVFLLSSSLLPSTSMPQLAMQIKKKNLTTNNYTTSQVSTEILGLKNQLYLF